jgi:hypothetical protein
MAPPTTRAPPAAESVGSLDFDLAAEERDALSNRVRHAAEQFLASWDYPEYLRVCRGDSAATTEVKRPRRRHVDSQMLCGTT